MLELLFLLLPVAVAYGWYMGRRGVRIDEERKSSQRSKNYAAGINFLLSDQSDKAVDLFIDLLQVDTDTIDTHLALGNLFRQRGEVDRAIKIHQNLVARSLESSLQQNLSMLELARDFIAAGLLDRAESVLLKLLDDDEIVTDARRMLLQIYEQLQDWEKAIQIASKIKDVSYNRLVAHYHCQLAEQLLQSAKVKDAMNQLKKAIKLDSTSIRAYIMQATVSIDLKDFSQAMKCINLIAEIDSSFVVESLKLLEKIKSQIAPSDYSSMLQNWLNQSQNASVALAISDIVYEAEGADAAEEFILKHIKRNPTMKGFHKLMSYHLEAMHDDKATESIRLLRSLVEKQITLKPLYRCQQCGFSSKLIFWHCPACKQWGTLKPIQGLDGD